MSFLSQHHGLLFGLALLPSLAAAQWPATIPLDTFHPPLWDPAQMCYNPINNHVYVSCAAKTGDTNVAVLDGSTLKRIAALSTGANRANSVLYSPLYNKVYAASGGVGGTIAVIDCGTDSVTAIIRDVVSKPSAMCVNPVNGKIYVAALEGSSVSIIDGEGDTVRATVRTGRSPYSLCTNTLGTKVYVANTCEGVGTWDSTITVIDGETDEVMKTIQVGLDPRSLVYVESLNLLYCANRGAWWRPDSTVSVIDCSSDNVIATIVVCASPSHLGYNRFTNKLYCGPDSYDDSDDSGWLTVVDCGSNSVLRTIPLQNVIGLVGDAAGNLVYAVSSKVDQVSVIDCLTDSIIAGLPTGRGPWGEVCLTPPNGTFLVSCSGSEDIAAFDVATRQTTARELLGARFPRAVVSHPDTALVYVACGLNAVAVIDGETNLMTGVLTVGLDPSALVYSPLSGHVYCANAGGDGFHPESTVSVIDPSQGSVLKEIVVGPGPSLLAYNDVEGKVYVAGRDMIVRVIDVRTDSVVREAVLDSLPQYMVFGSSCNRLFVATRWSNRCALWVLDGSSDSVVAAHRPSGSYPCDNVSIGWNPDARRAYLFYTYRFTSNSVAVWDAVADTLREVINMNDPTISSAYDSSDSTLYAASGQGRRLGMLDGSADSLVGYLDLPQCVGRQSVCYSPRSGRTYCTNEGSANVAVVINRSSWGRVPVGLSPSLVYVAPNGEMVYVGNPGAGSLTAFPDTMFVGIEGAQSPVLPRSDIRATVTTRRLIMSAEAPETSVDYTLLDASGRHVMQLRPGVNDIGRVAPGVYFVRESPTDHHNITAPVRRIVVVR